MTSGLAFIHSYPNQSALLRLKCVGQASMSCFTIVVIFYWRLVQRTEYFFFFTFDICWRVLGMFPIILSVSSLWKRLFEHALILWWCNDQRRVSILCTDSQKARFEKRSQILALWVYELPFLQFLKARQFNFAKEGSGEKNKTIHSSNSCLRMHERKI